MFINNPLSLHSVQSPGVLNRHRQTARRLRWRFISTLFRENSESNYCNTSFSTHSYKKWQSLRHVDTYTVSSPVIFHIWLLVVEIRNFLFSWLVVYKKKMNKKIHYFSQGIKSLIEDFVKRNQLLVFYNLKPSVVEIFRGVRPSEFHHCQTEQQLHDFLKGKKILKNIESVCSWWYDFNPYNFLRLITEHYFKSTNNNAKVKRWIKMNSLCGIYSLFLALEKRYDANLCFNLFSSFFCVHIFQICVLNSSCYFCKYYVNPMFFLYNFLYVTINFQQLIYLKLHIIILFASVMYINIL